MRGRPESSPCVVAAEAKLSFETFGDTATRGDPVTGQETNVLELARNVKYTLDGHTSELERIHNNQKHMAKDLTEVKQNVKELLEFKVEANQQFKGLHTRMNSLQEEFKGMRKDMAGMQKDMVDVKSDIQKLTLLVMSIPGVSKAADTLPNIAVTAAPNDEGEQGLEPVELRELQSAHQQSGRTIAKLSALWRKVVQSLPG